MIPASCDLRYFLALKILNECRFAFIRGVPQTSLAVGAIAKCIECTFIGNDERMSTASCYVLNHEVLTHVHVEGILVIATTEI